MPRTNATMRTRRSARRRATYTPTLNATYILIGIMAAADIAPVAEALLVAGQVSSPLHATLLAPGIGISLVGLRKKAGHTIATLRTPARRIG